MGGGGTGREREEEEGGNKIISFSCGTHGRIKEKKTCLFFTSVEENNPL